MIRRSEVALCADPKIGTQVTLIGKEGENKEQEEEEMWEEERKEEKERHSLLSKILHSNQICKI